MPIKGDVLRASELAFRNGQIQSGLNADFIDGFSVEDLALRNHNHDTVYLKLIGGTMTGDLTLDKKSVIVTNPNNSSATLTMGWLSDSPRLKVGGSGTGSTGTFKIQNADDSNRMTLDSSGNAVFTGSVTAKDITVAGNKIWHAGNHGAGSGLDADLLDGIDSTGFLRRNADTDTTGKITITRDGDAIVFNKNNTASFSGLLFTSTGNAGSDYAYIRYYDDVSNFYAPYDNGGSSENSALVIGVENDGVGVPSDYLVLRGPTKIILDAFASSGASERVAEFRRQGTIVSYIDNTGKYNGDVSSNQIEVKSTSTSNKFVIDFNEKENSLDFIYT